ncbi:MAG: DUF5683 domain-containing protein [Candidatus Cloacimonadales bacterium]|nr:DUF5683 domain-containing protein [Candidatus Cloacimonadales bacterium]
MRKSIVMFFIIFLAGNLFCQDEIEVNAKNDSLLIEKSQPSVSSQQSAAGSELIIVEKDSIQTKIPFKAAALSFFIPGGGQFYNENYLKSAAVFALEGSLIALAAYHYSESERYYDKSKDSLSYTYDQRRKYYGQYVNYYEKRQSDFWWLGTVIFLSTIDAYVDAHLFDYDDRKNKIHLKFENNMISLQYNF